MLKRNAQGFEPRINPSKTLIFKNRNVYSDKSRCRGVWFRINRSAPSKVLVATMAYWLVNKPLFLRQKKLHKCYRLIRIQVVGV